MPAGPLIVEGAGSVGVTLAGVGSDISVSLTFLTAGAPGVVVFSTAGVTPLATASPGTGQPTGGLFAWPQWKMRVSMEVIFGPFPVVGMTRSPLSTTVSISLVSRLCT